MQNTIQIVQQMLNELPDYYRDLDIDSLDLTLIIEQYEEVKDEMGY